MERLEQSGFTTRRPAAGASDLRVEVRFDLALRVADVLTYLERMMPEELPAPGARYRAPDPAGGKADDSAADSATGSTADTPADSTTDSTADPATGSIPIRGRAYGPAPGALLGALYVRSELEWERARAILAEIVATDQEARPGLGRVIPADALRRFRTDLERIERALAGACADVVAWERLGGAPAGSVGDPEAARALGEALHALSAESRELAEGMLRHVLEEDARLLRRRTLPALEEAIERRLRLRDEAADALSAAGNEELRVARLAGDVRALVREFYAELRAIGAVSEAVLYRVAGAELAAEWAREGGEAAPRQATAPVRGVAPAEELLPTGETGPPAESTPTEVTAAANEARPAGVTIPTEGSAAVKAATPVPAARLGEAEAFPAPLAVDGPGLRSVAAVRLGAAADRHLRPAEAEYGFRVLGVRLATRVGIDAADTQGGETLRTQVEASLPLLGTTSRISATYRRPVERDGSEAVDVDRLRTVAGAHGTGAGGGAGAARAGEALALAGEIEVGGVASVRVGYEMRPGAGDGEVGAGGGRIGAGLEYNLGDHGSVQAGYHWGTGRRGERSGADLGLGYRIGEHASLLATYSMVRFSSPDGEELGDILGEAKLVVRF